MNEYGDYQNSSEPENIQDPEQGQKPEQVSSGERMTGQEYGSERRTSEEGADSQGSYGQNSYSQSSYGQNGYSQGGYGQNSYSQGGYGQSGYSQGGYDQNAQAGNSYENVHYSFAGAGQNQGKQKKKHSGLVALLVTLAALALVAFGIFMMARHLVVRTTIRKTETSVAGSETEKSGDASEETAAAAETEEESKAVTLVKSGSVSSVSSSGEVILTDVSEIVENVMPCLVAITDNLEVASTYSYNPYNYFFGGSSSGSSQSTQQTVSSASGVIIGQSEEELLIVTNAHVVNVDLSSSGYTVVSSDFSATFIDGESAQITVKGEDENMDLAVVAVRLSDLSESTKEAIRVAVVGNSDELKVGEGVIAIGNAKGYGQSVTMGIVSAKDREVTNDGVTRTLLQTDAAINPGNSGGGLFNSKGELVGINESKYASTDVEGMCFAIPITSAEEVIESLMNRETVAEEDKGYLGIQGTAVPDSYVSAYGYPSGVSVTKITENSPAELAGLQIYDIITSINGTEVSTMSELKELVNSYKAGTTVTLTVSRPEGRSFKEMSVDVTLVRYADLVDNSTSETEEAEQEQGGSGSRSDGDTGSDRDADMDEIIKWFYEQMYGSQSSQSAE